jgi:Flp pilus assembly protein TadD
MTMKGMVHGALAAAVAALALTTVAGEPALAQRKKREEAGAPKLQLTEAVRTELAAAQAAIQAKDFPTAKARLDAAAAVPNRTQDDNDIIGQLQIQLGQESQDTAMLKQGIEGRLAAGKLTAEEQPRYVRNLAAIAVRANDWGAAQTQFERLAQMTPNDPVVQADLGRIYWRNKQGPQAFAAFDKSIAASEAAGAKPEENVYATRLQIAFDYNLNDKVDGAARALVKNYPSAKNWNVALFALRRAAKFDDQGELDTLRLSRAAGALTGQNEYLEYADTAQRRGLPGEGRMVLEEGIAKNAVDANSANARELRGLLTAQRASTDKASLAGLERDARNAPTGRQARATGDGYLSHGEYAKAAEMYRLALQKGGEDANTVNTRLGIALARSGDKAGAREAFGRVKGGQRETLAAYWMIWLDQQA